MGKVAHDSLGEKAQQVKFNETLKRMLKTPPEPKQGKRGTEAPRPGSGKEVEKSRQNPKAGG